MSTNPHNAFESEEKKLIFQQFSVVEYRYDILVISAVIKLTAIICEYLKFKFSAQKCSTVRIPLKQLQIFNGLLNVVPPILIYVIVFSLKCK